MYLPVQPGRLIGGRKIEDALYMLATLRRCSLQLLLVYYVTRWFVYKNVVTSNQIISAVYHTRLVLDEKSTTRFIHEAHCVIGAHLQFLRKLKDLKSALWSEKYGKL